MWTGTEWVDTSLPGIGSDFGQAQADGLYLSKVSNDTAQGKITFAAGLNAGGDASSSSRPTGVAIEETGLLLRLDQMEAAICRFFRRCGQRDFFITSDGKAF